MVQSIFTEEKTSEKMVRPSLYFRPTAGKISGWLKTTKVEKDKNRRISTSNKGFLQGILQEVPILTKYILTQAKLNVNIFFPFFGTFLLFIFRVGKAGISRVRTAFPGYETLFFRKLKNGKEKNSYFLIDFLLSIV